MVFFSFLLGANVLVEEGIRLARPSGSFRGSKALIASDFAPLPRLRPHHGG